MEYRTLLGLQPERQHHDSDEAAQAATRLAELERRQALYRAAQEKKKARLKERYRTDPELRRKRVEQGRAWTKRTARKQEVEAGAVEEPPPVR